MQEMSTLTIKGKTYEVVDKQARETMNEILAILTGGGTATKYYTVTNNLTNAEVSPKHSLIAEGEAYAATITIPDDYEMTECSVYMGETKISVVANEFSIEAVTDNITITVSAEKIESGEDDSGTGDDSGDTTTYAVRYELENCYARDEATEYEVTAGGQVQETIYPADGYKIYSAHVSMGGEIVDIYDADTDGDEFNIYIEEVTADITVLAQAVAIDSGSEGEDSGDDTESVSIQVATDDDRHAHVYLNGEDVRGILDVEYGSTVTFELGLDEGYQFATGTPQISKVSTQEVVTDNYYDEDTQTITFENVTEDFVIIVSAELISS